MMSLRWISLTFRIPTKAKIRVIGTYWSPTTTSKSGYAVPRGNKSMSTKCCSGPIYGQTVASRWHLCMAAPVNILYGHRTSPKRSASFRVSFIYMENHEVQRPNRFLKAKWPGTIPRSSPTLAVTNSAGRIYGGLLSKSHCWPAVLPQSPTNYLIIKQSW